MFQFQIKQIEHQRLNDVSVHVWQDDLAEDFIHLVPEDAEFEVRHPSRVCCTCHPRRAKIQGDVLVSLIFGRLGLILRWENSTPKMWLVQVQAVFNRGSF